MPSVQDALGDSGLDTKMVDGHDEAPVLSQASHLFDHLEPLGVSEDMSDTDIGMVTDETVSVNDVGTGELEGVADVDEIRASDSE